MRRPPTQRVRLASDRAGVDGAHLDLGGVGHIETNAVVRAPVGAMAGVTLVGAAVGAEV